VRVIGSLAACRDPSEVEIREAQPQHASRRQSSSPARPAPQTPGHRRPRASWAGATATSRRPSRTTEGCRWATPSPAPEASDQQQLDQPARPCAIGVLSAACLPGPVLVASGGVMWMRQVRR
jgi:hypothetical protein